MKWIVLLSLFILTACNSKEPGLSSLAGISNPNTTAPYVVGVTVPASGIYIENSNLIFTVTFNKPVTVIGIPRLAFLTDTGLRHVLYSGGTGTTTLTFESSVVAGTIDDNGIVLSQAIDLNGGSIFDDFTDEDALLTFASPATWGILINAGDPEITTIIPPNDGTYSGGTTLRFKVNFNARVCGSGSPRLPLTIGSSTRYATLASGQPCGTSFFFDYVVAPGETDSNGIQLNGVSVNLIVLPASIKDSFGDNAILFYTAATTYPNVKVGAVQAIEQPKIVPPNGVYGIGSFVEFTITFDKPVTVVNGTPQLKLTVGGNVRDAFYLGGTGTASIVFRYTVAEGESDTDGIQIGSMQWNGSNFADADGNNAPLTHSWPSTTNVKVDGIRPTIASIVRPVDGIYRPGDSLSFTVNWSEHVNFTGGGFPHLKMSFDSTVTNKEAHSSSNNGLVTTYSYSIQNGDADFNGIVLPAANLTLPAGVTVTDDAGNTASTLGFSAQNTAGIFVAPAGVDHWYDARNTASTGSSSTTLTQFKDLIGTTHFSIITAPGFGGTPKKINFSNVGDSIKLPTLNNFQKIYIVLETKSSTPGDVTFESAGARVIVDLSAGNVSVTNYCGNCAKYFNGTSWAVTPSNGIFGTYALNSKKVIMLDYQNINGVELNFGSGFSGYIHEIFILSGTHPTTFAGEFLQALQTKHSGLTLP